MKRTKNQAPSSRETSNSKDQPGFLDDSSSQLLKGASVVPLPAWWDETPTGGGLILNEGCSDGRHAFDLEERTAAFGENIVRFSKKIPRGPTNDRLIDQLVGCATSVGGNYCEANEGVSKKDFRHPLSRCVKEAKETKFFLRMVVASEPTLAQEARVLYREANELMLIFASMYRKSR